MATDRVPQPTATGSAYYRSGGGSGVGEGGAAAFAAKQEARRAESIRQYGTKSVEYRLAKEKGRYASVEVQRALAEIEAREGIGKPREYRISGKVVSETEYYRKRGIAEKVAAEKWEQQKVITAAGRRRADVRKGEQIVVLKPAWMTAGEQKEIIAREVRERAKGLDVRRQLELQRQRAIKAMMLVEPIVKLTEKEKEKAYWKDIEKVKKIITPKIIEVKEKKGVTPIEGIKLAYAKLPAYEIPFRPFKKIGEVKEKVIKKAVEYTDIYYSPFSRIPIKIKPSKMKVREIIPKPEIKFTETGERVFYETAPYATPLGKYYFMSEVAEIGEKVIAKEPLTTEEKVFGTIGAVLGGLKVAELAKKIIPELSILKSAAARGEVIPAELKIDVKKGASQLAKSDRKLFEEYVKEIQKLAKEKPKIKNIKIKEIKGLTKEETKVIENLLKENKKIVVGGNVAKRTQTKVELPTKELELYYVNTQSLQQQLITKLRQAGVKDVSAKEGYIYIRGKRAIKIGDVSKLEGQIAVTPEGIAVSKLSGREIRKLLGSKYGAKRMKSFTRVYGSLIEETRPVRAVAPTPFWRKPEIPKVEIIKPTRRFVKGRLEEPYPKVIKGISDKQIREFTKRLAKERGIDFNKLSKVEQKWLMGQVRAKIRTQPELFLPKARKLALERYKPEFARERVVEKGIRLREERATKIKADILDLSKTRPELFIPEARRAALKKVKPIEKPKVYRDISGIKFTLETPLKTKIADIAKARKVKEIGLKEARLTKKTKEELLKEPKWFGEDVKKIALEKVKKVKPIEKPKVYRDISGIKFTLETPLKTKIADIAKARKVKEIGLKEARLTKATRAEFLKEPKYFGEDVTKIALKKYTTKPKKAKVPKELEGYEPLVKGKGIKIYVEKPTKEWIKGQVKARFRTQELIIKEGKQRLQLIQKPKPKVKPVLVSTTVIPRILRKYGLEIKKPKIKYKPQEVIGMALIGKKPKLKPKVEIGVKEAVISDLEVKPSLKMAKLEVVKERVKIKKKRFIFPVLKEAEAYEPREYQVQEFQQATLGLEQPIQITKIAPKEEGLMFTGQFGKVAQLGGLGQGLGEKTAVAEAQVLFQPTKIKQVQRVQQVQKIQQKLRQQQRLKQKQRLKQAERVKQMERIKQRERLKLREKIKIKTPFGKEPSKVKKVLEKIKKKAPAYQLFVRRFGEFKPIGEPMLKGKAIKFGEEITKETLAATFQIRKTEKMLLGKDIPYEPSPKIFREYKIRKKVKYPMELTWIERRRYRLKAKPEVKEIQMFKRKKKRRKMKWL